MGRELLFSCLACEHLADHCEQMMLDKMGHWLDLAAGLFLCFYENEHSAHFIAPLACDSLVQGWRTCGPLDSNSHQPIANMVSGQGLWKS